MTNSHQITVNGRSFRAGTGEVLLDAALRNGIDLPHDCRAGHCGTCCVRLVSGEVAGGQGAERGVVHACQCRIAGDAVVEGGQPPVVRSTDGVLFSLRRLSADVVEVGIRTARSLPYHAGQYVQVQFEGFPKRPYSLTLPVLSDPASCSVWFHIRQMERGRVSSALGGGIKPGHPVRLTGPFGSAHFRPNLPGRLIMVATNTGFAPIWSIAAAALRENPQRRMMVLAGARHIQSLYMAPALVQLTEFPHVRVLPVCSTPQTFTDAVMPGRPTDYLPQLVPGDVMYACGAPQMVESVRAIAAHAGVVCYADPFLASSADADEDGFLTRAIRWFAVPPGGKRCAPAVQMSLSRRSEPILTYPRDQPSARRDLDAQSA